MNNDFKIIREYELPAPQDDNRRSKGRTKRRIHVVITDIPKDQRAVTEAMMRDITKGDVLGYAARFMHKQEDTET